MIEKKNSNSIETHFKTMPDPRRHNKKHKLIDIITISICAVICGADAFEHIEDFGKSKIEWFKQFLDLPFGIPSHDTFGRIFAMLDPKEFQDCFIDWI